VVQFCIRIRAGAALDPACRVARTDPRAYTTSLNPAPCVEGDGLGRGDIRTSQLHIFSDVQLAPIDGRVEQRAPDADA
jgi:hypothetical protein